MLSLIRFSMLGLDSYFFYISLRFDFHDNSSKSTITFYCSTSIDIPNTLTIIMVIANFDLVGQEQADVHQHHHHHHHEQQHHPHHH